jgi:hypothetical protein
MMDKVKKGTVINIQPSQISKCHCYTILHVTLTAELKKKKNNFLFKCSALILAMKRKCLVPNMLVAHREAKQGDCMFFYTIHHSEG